MAQLTGNKIKDTYLGLLKTNGSGILTSGFQRITDGSGLGSQLYLSLTQIKFYDAYIFPDADGSANQVLKTDGAGVLTWENDSLSNTLNFSGGTGTGLVTLDTQVLAFTGTANEIETSASSQAITLSFPTAGVTLPNGSIATTQTASNNSTKVATTAYVDNQVSTAGTVTSVALSVPTGLTVTGSPITTSGTIAIANTSGYSIPTDAKQTQWDTAYTNRITTATSPLSITTNTISLNTVPVSNGGTGATTLTGILLGNGTSAISSITSANDGYILTADGAGGYAFEVASGGGVNVSGTPVADQIAIWTDATTIKGDPTFIIDSNHKITLYQPNSVPTNLSNYNIGGGNIIVGGTKNTGFGSNNLNSVTGASNTAFGCNALTALGTGYANNAVGSEALLSLSTGYNNVAIGLSAGKLITAATDNVFIGAFSASNKITGNFNIAIGAFAYSGNNAGSNLNSGNYNVIIGSSAMITAVGSNNNVVIGHESSYNNANSENNTAVGFQSLYTSATNNGNNTAIGFKSLYLSTGESNLAIGSLAGSAITTGNKNVIIGSNTGSTIATSSNNIIISDGDGNNRLQFGSTGAATFSGTSVIGVTVANTNYPIGEPYNSFGNLNIYTTNPEAQNMGGSLTLGGTGAGGVYSYGAIYGKKESTVAGSALGYLAFATDDNNNLVERMRITSGGNVLIGTTTDAGYKLDVNGTGRFKASAATYAGGSLILTSSTGTNPIYLTSNGGFFALSNGGSADHFLIASTGAASFSENVVLTGSSKQIRLENSSFVNFTNTGNTIQRGYIQHDGTNLNIASPVGSITLINALSGTSATFSGNVTAPNAILGNNTNNTNSIKIIDNASTKTYIGSGFGAAFINNNSFFNGTAYVFDDTTKPNSQITLSAGGIFLSTGAVNTDPTTKVAITNGGNVGIGTNDPSLYPIAPQLVLDTGTGGGITIKSSSSSYGVVCFADGTTGNEQYRGYIQYSHNFSGIVDGMLFGTEGTNRLTITSGGNVLMGTLTDSAGVRLKVAGGIIGCLDVYNNTTGVGANLNIDANGFFARSTSSKKYKKNINNLTKGLNEVLQLRAVTYNSIKENETQTYGGLIAEEVHDLGLTEFVQYAEDGTPDALSYPNMIALLTKAIQEQQTIIEDLKTRIEQLEV